MVVLEQYLKWFCTSLNRIKQVVCTWRVKSNCEMWHNMLFEKRKASRKTVARDLSLEVSQVITLSSPPSQFTHTLTQSTFRNNSPHLTAKCSYSSSRMVGALIGTPLKICGSREAVSVDKLANKTSTENQQGTWKSITIGRDYWRWVDKQHQFSSINL